MFWITVRLNIESQSLGTGPLPVIYTVRTKSQGGAFPDDEDAVGTFAIVFLYNSQFLTLNIPANVVLCAVGVGHSMRIRVGGHGVTLGGETTFKVLGESACCSRNICHWISPFQRFEWRDCRRPSSAVHALRTWRSVNLPSFPCFGMLTFVLPTVCRSSQHCESGDYGTDT